MTTTTRPPAPVEPNAPQPVEHDLSLGQLARRVYALFHNKRFGLLLILAMGILTLFGVLFIQAPEPVRADPAQYAEWLEQAKQRYGGWAVVLDILGVFHMFSSLAFRTVTTLLALSIIACTTHRMPNLWKQAKHPHVHVREGFHERARTHGAAYVEASPEEAYAAATAALKKKGFRVVRDSDTPYAAYTDRFRWAPFGTVAAHAAFVIILVGVLVTGSLGFRDDDFVVPVGQRVDVGNGTGMAVEAKAFTDTYHPDGRPKDYYSDLVLYKDGQQVAARQVRVNTPLRHGGVAFNQATFGVAADVAITGDGVDRRASVPLKFTTQDEKGVYGTLDLPEKNFEVYVMGAASGSGDGRVKPGQMLVEVYGKDQRKPLASSVLDQGKPAKVGDLSITFERERQYTGLMVARDPGAPLVWIGSIMIMIGMCLTMFLRHHRVWLRADPEGTGSIVRLASPDRHDITFERWFASLVAGLGTPVSTTHQSKES
ncbi:cytochrome c biogenesis protein ResB [Mariniluteicoccus flavus]